MRNASIKRNTKETKIELELNLDGNGKADIDTGIGFIDHMLTLLAFHSNFDLKVKCNGDINVDSHHSVEDLGIVLGQAFNEAIGDKKGITRYGSFTIPMDETLVMCDLDISGRPYLVFNSDIPKVQLGNYETEMTEEFFRAFANNALITLHINELYGENVHHIIEAMFKSLGRALKEAVTIDEKNKDKVVSSKGVL
ncbi:MAG: imidazoleglycerol-phosphate dehydratase HisB [Thomasclavelia sp.]|jgi:imidazoleglycerol-phosphate dehydratase|nr:imidazoleglycerol-phosphate dehydratase HisB [Thomasclavelia sp.]